MSDSQIAIDSPTLPLAVANTGFMVDRLGMDCAPLQFLRELTQNAIEAIKRTPSKSGEIIWDADWVTFDLDGKFKLCITDTGDGMTGDEMVKYINHLSSSGSVQSHAGNYGVGAKVAAATRNHAGLVYLSWKTGVGSMIHLWRDPRTEQYGLQQLERPDGTYGHWAFVEDDVKPDVIKGHGTRVILYGNKPDDDTMKAPEGAPSPSRWVTKYLNARYFRFPSGITVRAREGWDYDRADKDRNLLRKITGEEKYLEDHAQSSGKVRLAGAHIHWWILRDEGALGQNSGVIASSGHCAALWNDELYEMTTGRTSTAYLQLFGVIFGYQRVVIYIEPTNGPGQEITTNTSRTALLLNGQPLPWADWAEEFRNKLPREMAEHIEAAAANTSSSDHADAIRERLKQIEELFKLTRYRPAKAGPLRIDPETTVARGAAAKRDSSLERNPTAGSGEQSAKIGTVYNLFLAEKGTPGEEAKPDIFPQVRWISVSDGTRQPGDLEDRAARYLTEQNILLINADFRVFTDMTKRWTKFYDGVPAAENKVREVVREWFEQSLIEAVVSASGLRDSQYWSIEHVKQLCSEEGLTASVLPRWHIEQSIKRSLGSRLGSLRSKAS